MTAIRIKAMGLSKTYTTQKLFSSKQYKALVDVSFEVEEGMFFGIIGKNGSGKTTLLRLLMGALSPTSGQLSVVGKPLKLIPGMGFNPHLTVRENALLNGAFFGFSRPAIRTLLPQIMFFAELEAYADEKLKFLSDGMRSRLAFAVAMHCNPDILIMDEFFGARGDASFRQKADLAFHEALLANKTIVHTSHNMTTIQQYCHKVLVLHEGRQVFLGEAEGAIQCYRALNQ